MTQPTTFVSYADLERDLSTVRDELALSENRLRLVTEARDRLADQYRDERRSRAADIERIGEAFKNSAENNGWEDSYDTVVDELNGFLSFELPTRRRPYRITFTYNVTFSGVEATDEDDATEQVSSDVRRIESLIDNYSGDFSVGSSVDYDSEVELDD